MSWPTAAADRAATTVEEPQFYSMFLSCVVQLAMGFVELPCAGEHASVFVGVGVAQHDFLPSSPGIEQRLILGMTPDGAHDAAGSA